MRIWDLRPEILCRSHLLGEHRELHALWSILTQEKRGYAHHPETQRWKGKLKALFLRHENLVREMARRVYRHHSPLDVKLARGKARQDVLLDTRREQIRLLRAKGCGCKMKRLRPRTVDKAKIKVTAVQII